MYAPATALTALHCPRRNAASVPCRGPREGEQRYSPAEVVATEVAPVTGRPDTEKICTSHVERHNLTMRMQIRRFTRLTNAFSKKWENHYAALSLYFAYYNFVRIHSAIRVTPAMEAGLTEHVWSLQELLGFGFEQARAA
jgi:IS1 transposase